MGELRQEELTQANFELHMAREEQDREDLLRDARALAIRVELWLDTETEPVVVGFRGDAASLFFGADPVYHFNAQHALRRAFVGGELLKAEGGRLIRLRRSRTPSQVFLLAREWSSAETQEFLDVMDNRVRQLRLAIENHKYGVGRAVPSPEVAMNKLLQWLAGWPARPQIAETPHVRG